MVNRIVCSHAGGQGKTTVAQILNCALTDAQANFEMVSADTLVDNGSSKLGLFYPGSVTELGAGPEISATRASNDKNASIKYWDPLGPILLRGSNVIDLGANVLSPVLEWARLRKAATLMMSRNAPDVHFFVVCRAERRAVDDAREIVEAAVKNDSFVVNKIFLCLNESTGSFDDLGIDAVIRAGSQAGVETNVVKIPACNSEIWAQLETRYISLQSALQFSNVDAEKFAGLPMWSAMTALDDLEEWYDVCSENLRKAGAI